MYRLCSFLRCCCRKAGGKQDKGDYVITCIEGGTSTSCLPLLHSAREKVNIALYPIIRPRGGDFLYDDLEFEIMKKDIQLCKQVGCEGVVIGLLTAAGKIDLPRTKELVALAWPMGVTFHRLLI